MPIGNPILGEDEGDASGFSVSLTHPPASDVLIVAIGAIYNDPSSDKINAGHVRVYKHTIGGDPVWELVGQEINGENGDYLNYEERKFHISDRFGFACKLSRNGRRLIVGAPYYHGDGNRDAGYYHGKVRLFELQYTEDNEGDGSDSGTWWDGTWVQIARDIMGATKDSNSGHGLALDEAGKTIIVGGPSETGGSVKVYYQDEFSSHPSVAPSSQPSFTPSTTPSARPSLQPSTTPSARPSLQPSSVPSTSMSPSLQPSSGPSLNPSQTPSSFSGRTFQILSTSPKFSNVGNSNDGRKWCLEGKLSPVDTSQILMVRPCSPLRANFQTWFLDNGKLTLSNRNPGTFCVKDERRSLFLQSCDLLGTSRFSFTSRDENTPGAIVVSRNGKSFYVAISTDKIFERLRLYTKQSVNPSKETWQLNYVSTQSPSIIPSNRPSVVSLTVSSLHDALPISLSKIPPWNLAERDRKSVV